MFYGQTHCFYGHFQYVSHHQRVHVFLGPNFWGPVGRGLLLEGSWYPSMVLRPSANQKVVLRTMKTSSAKGQNWFCEPTGFYEPQWGSEWSLVSPELRPGSSLRPKCGLKCCS